MSFIFEGQEVYEGAHVKRTSPAFFAGTSQSLRTALQQKGVPETAILYGIRTKNGGWNVSGPTINRAVPLVLKSWVDEHVPGFIPEEGETVVPPVVPKSIKRKITAIEVNDVDVLQMQHEIDKLKILLSEKERVVGLYERVIDALLKR